MRHVHIKSLSKIQSTDRRQPAKARRCPAAEPLESRVLFSASIVPVVATVKLPAVFVPGDNGTVQVTIENQGDASAGGVLGLELFASTDTMPGDGMQLKTPTNLAHLPINLAAGKSKSVTATVTIPSSLLPGTYNILAQLMPVSGFGAGVVSMVAAAGPATVQGVWSFGTVGSRNNVKLVHVLNDGTKETFSLNVGTGTLSEDGSGNLSVSTTGTTLSSTMAVALMGATKFATLAGITTDAALGTLNFSKAHLMTGTLNIAGDSKKVVLANASDSTLSFNGTIPTALTLAGVNDCTFNSTDPFTSLSATYFDNSQGGGALTAPWIGMVTTKSYFQEDLNLNGNGAPGGVTVKTINTNSIFTSKWNITGDVGSMLVNNSINAGSYNISGTLKSLTVNNSIDGAHLAAANIGSILVRNSISLYARILAGANFGPDGVLGGGDDTFAAGTIGSLKVLNSVTFGCVIAAGLDAMDDSFPLTGLTGNDSLLPGGAIKSVTVNTQVSSDSRILASTLPPKAKIHFASVATATDPRFNLP